MQPTTLKTLGSDNRLLGMNLSAEAPDAAGVEASAESPERGTPKIFGVCLGARASECGAIKSISTLYS